MTEEQIELYNKIDALEAENTELKEEISADNLSIVVLLEQTQDDLLKAQKLLKKALGYIENIDDKLYDEIEQFLNIKE